LRTERFTTVEGKAAVVADDPQSDYIIIVPDDGLPVEHTLGDLEVKARQIIASLAPTPPLRRFNPMQATVGDLVGKKLSAWQNVKVHGATAFDTVDAPDDCFAIVPEAARGPRGDKSLRKLPLVSVERKQFDPVMVRNALTAFKKDADSLLSGTGIAKNDALGKICSAARELGIDNPLCAGMEWSQRVNVPPGRAVASAFSRFDPMQYTVGDLVGKKPVEAAASGPSVVRIDGKLDLSQPTVGDLVQGHTSRYGPPAGLQKTERLRSPFLTL
jgi:hypothetical protein